MRAAAALALLGLIAVPGARAGVADDLAWRVVRLEGTTLQIRWPKGKGAEWTLDGTEGSFSFRDKDEFGHPRSYSYHVLVVPFDPDSHWDAVLNQESGEDAGPLHTDRVTEETVLGEGISRGGSVIDGDVSKGKQAGYPTRTWTLARRDQDGVLRDYRDVYVLRAPAHYVSIKYTYSPPGAREEQLDVFQAMTSSVQPYGRAAKKKSKKKRKAQPAR